MSEIKINISDKLLSQLPSNQEELEEVLKLGLKRINARRKIKTKNIAAETFGALPIKNHNLIEQVCEQAKYGE